MGEEEREHKFLLIPKESQIDRNEVAINGKSKVCWPRSLNTIDVFTLLF